MAWFFAFGAAILLGFWVFAGIRGMRAYTRAVHLAADSDFPLPSSPPPVSILVPARNEEEIVGECIRSILNQDYPNFEVIAVDDDSSDATGKILDELAKNSNGQLRVLHIKGELPPGWVGKHYALTLAVAHSRGDWMLFSDADMLHEPQALSRAVGLALKQKADLVSLLPRVICVSFWERLIMPLWAILLGVVFPIEEVNDPRRRSAIAAGGFILISRNAFDSVGGYNAAADHIVDDVMLAKRVKDKGFRIFVALGEKLSQTRMYKDFGDLWEGVEKSAGAALDFRWWMLAASQVFLLSNVAIPAAGIFCATLWWQGALPDSWQLFTILSLALGALLFLFHFSANVGMKIPALPFALLAPISYILYAIMMASSFFKGRFGDGVEWKGRRYYGASKPLPASKMGI